MWRGHSLRQAQGRLCPRTLTMSVLMTVRMLMSMTMLGRMPVFMFMFMFVVGVRGRKRSRHSPRHILLRPERFAGQVYFAVYPDVDLSCGNAAADHLRD